MTISTVVTYTRKLLGGLSTAQLPDADAIDYLNDAFDDFQWDLAEQRSDYFVEKSVLNSISTGDSVVQFPTDTIRVKAVDVNFYDPTDTTKFFRATEFDASGAEYRWDYYLENQAKDAPLVDIRGGYFEVAPKSDANYTDAVKIIYLARLTVYNTLGTALTDGRFTATTDLLPYPLTLNPHTLSYKMAEIYTLSKGAVGTQQQKADRFRRGYESKISKIIKNNGSNLESIESQGVRMDTWNI